MAEAPASAPAAPAATAPAAQPAQPAAQPAAPEVKQDAKPAVPDGSIVAPVDGKPAAPALDDVRKFLTEKGAKPEDLDKLDEAALRAKYDEAKAEPTGEPEAIEIKVPEGIEIDEKTLGDFKGILADAKLSPSERAQKLVDMHASALKAAQEAPYNLWRQTQAEWQTKVKSDPEMGGQNFDVMRSTIAKAISDVGGTEAAKMFEAFAFTGAGNHPEIVRLVYRMSKALTEGGPVDGDKPVGSDKTGKVLQALYPSATGTAKAG